MHEAYSHEEGAQDPPVSMSPADLVADVATALEQDRHCGRWLPMLTEDQELLWVLDT